MKRFCPVITNKRGVDIELKTMVIRAKSKLDAERAFCIEYSKRKYRNITFERAKAAT